MRAVLTMVGMLVGLIVPALLFVHTARAESVTRDQAKEILRLQYTEICSTPRPAGDALPHALDEAFKADPATWGPWILWWNDLMAKYRKAGCGDA